MAGAKTKPSQLIEEVAEKLIIYLKSGKLAATSFIQKLNLNINNLEELLRIHFILKPEVREFVKKLPYRLRNIKTSTEKITQFLRSEVRGKIDWQKTIKQRCKNNNLQQNTFVCQQMDRNFNIKENLVLKRLLEVIYQVTVEELAIDKKDYSWLEDWLGDRKLARELKNSYQKNIYLNRIEAKETQVTERMISDTKKSRNFLYQEAAQLLDLYRRLQNINEWTETDHQEIKELLSNTFIQPKQDDVLFELYWIIKLIETNTTEAELNLVDGNNDLVASWEAAEKSYLLYHDAVESSRLEWQVALDEVAGSRNSYLKRQVKSRKLSQKLTQEVWGKKSGSNFWAGRPDIVIEIIDRETANLEKIIIGEVKYTAQLTTAKQGLEELIDYLALVKQEGTYLHDGSLEESEVEIEGLLLVDRINKAGDSIRGIKVYNQAGEWKTKTYSERDIEL